MTAQAPDTRLNEASLLAAARERTGLSDFGDDAFRTPLAVLLDSIEREARLTPAGRVAQRTRLVGLLAARLQREAWFTKHPEIAAERVDVRFVVVGFPRTGTTLLQRILARDPRASWLGWWECRHPAPLPGWLPAEAASRPDPRIALAQAEAAAMLVANPTLAAVHPLDALAPDEDVMLLEHAFQSSPPAGLMNVPGYLLWHLAQDGEATYADHARWLQFLQWQKRLRGEPVGPFVLKAPHHMVHLDQLLARYPGAVIVQTHRDPLDTIPSLASMALELRRLVCDTPHPSECAEYALVTGRQRIARAERVRQANGARFADVWFGDVVQDALAVIERLYAVAGLELAADARAAMVRYVAENGRDKRPPHGYTLAQFGLDADSIKREFVAYREAHVLSRQRPA